MHSKFLRWLSLFGLFAVVAFQASAQAPAAPAAAPAPGSQLAPGRIKASRVIGKVTVEDKNTKAVREVANDMEITQGNIVHTAENSSVVLIFSSGASINLAHTSDLDIETFLQDPFPDNYEPSKREDEPSISRTEIKLTRGELVGNVKKLRNAGQPNGSTFKVGTPVGAAGIRGTTFRIVYRPTGNGQAFNFTLTTVEGNVEVQFTGQVTAPPTAVTQNQEVVINNVTVDTATNTLSITTSTGATTTTTTFTAPPVAQTADVTNVQAAQVAAQQIIQAVATTVFTAPPPTTQTQTQTNQQGTTQGSQTDTSNQNNQNQQSQSNQNSQTNNPPSNQQKSNPVTSPGGTNTGTDLTPGAGLGKQ